MREDSRFRQERDAGLIVDKALRNHIQTATQQARRLLESEFADQLEGTYDILPNGQIPEKAGSHLGGAGQHLRSKIVAVIHHRRAQGLKAVESVDAYLREAAFTTINRFAALKMLEARGITPECISKGEGSAGFKEFGMLASGLSALPDKGYRLFLESLFDEIGLEVRVLFDRRDVHALLWPRRRALAELLDILNRDELAPAWKEDETIGWFYQYFNSTEERKKMRDESQTPRNSRELAVRNQFFTPRYVVEFLTDNTLGRIWFEMCKGQSQLKEQCRYMVYKPDEELPERALKDPRELKIIDPACGSGHFLLYVFDLLLTIYTEAWESGNTPSFADTGHTLKEDYPEIGDLKKAVPELILRHNIHGIDIDPRAAQIAALALWMRAQRAYGDSDVGKMERPQIRKTNVVVAEPMPGEKEMLDAFCGSLENEALGKLVAKVFEEMRLAGEAGSLLKIEESLDRAIEKLKGTSFGWLAGNDEDFWAQAEQVVLSALEGFVKSQGQVVGQRLFAEDTARGLALIDLCRKEYDVALMNPPFGEWSAKYKKEAKGVYPNSYNDILAAFVDRWLHKLVDRGRVGAITSRTCFFLSSYQKWRENVVLGAGRPVVLADLGHGVMDAAMVEAAAYVVERGSAQI